MITAEEARKNYTNISGDIISVGDLVEISDIITNYSKNAKSSFSFIFVSKKDVFGDNKTIQYKDIFFFDSFDVDNNPELGRVSIGSVMRFKKYMESFGFEINVYNSIKTSKNIKVEVLW